MAKPQSALEERIHAVIAAAVSGAIEVFRNEVLAEVSRSLGQTPAIAVSSRRMGAGMAPGVAPKERSWPTCSVPGCGNKFFGPSGSARFCYEHYVQSGGQHPAKAAALEPAKRGNNGKSGDGTVRELLAFIARHPGLRSEQIRKEVGLAQPIVKAALAQLRAESKVRTQGNRRATTYSASQ